MVPHVNYSKCTQRTVGVFPFWASRILLYRNRIPAYLSTSPLTCLFTVKIQKLQITSTARPKSWEVLEILGAAGNRPWRLPDGLMAFNFSIMEGCTVSNLRRFTCTHPIHQLPIWMGKSFFFRGSHVRSFLVDQVKVTKSSQQWKGGISYL